MVRIAGLEVSALARLRSEKAHAALGAYLDAQERLERDGADLSEALFPVIGAAADGAIKASLVGLRRAVHRVRTPGPREWNDGLAAELPPDLRIRMRAWVERLRDHQVAWAEVADTVDAEAADRTEELRRLTRDPAFLHALNQSSPTLSSVLRTWHAHADRQPKRRSVARLATYVARAATKTSPFSTFTVNAVGTWSESSTATRLMRLGEMHCVLELDQRVFQRAQDLLLTDPHLAEVAPVRVNPSETRVDGALWFLAPTSEEPFVRTPETAAVAEVLRTVEAAEGITLGRLRHRLAERHGDAARIDRFVARLVTAGLLEVRLPIDDTAERPFADMARWLAKEAPAGLADVGDRASAIQAELDRHVPVGDTAGQRSRRRALDAAVDGLFAAIGEATGRHPAGEEAAQEGAPTHEQAVLTTPAAELSLPEWTPALQDLDTLRRWLAVHDPVLPLRLALATFVAERFGPGCRLPFLQLHQAVHEEIDGGSWIGAELRSGFELAVAADPLARPSSSLRRVADAYRLREAATTAALTGPRRDGVIEADPVQIAELAAQWPEWVQPTQSLVCWVQHIPGPRLVLNAAAAGYGRGRSRVHHQIRMAGGDPGPMTVPGTATAEFTGAFGLSLNRRRFTAQYALDYPGAVGRGHGRRRLRLSDLAVVHHPDSDLLRLESTSLGHPVHPLHLGMMADTLLPPAALLLSHVFGGSYLKHPAQAMLESVLASGSGEDVVHQPRVHLGRVVMRRATWFVPAHLVPVRAPGEQRAGYLYRLIRWLRSTGIPDHFFIRAVDPSLVRGRDTPAPPHWVFRKSRKPLYIDAANPFLVDVLDSTVNGEHTAALLFEEALPDPADARPVDGGPERRVTEYMIEISSRDA